MTQTDFDNTRYLSEMTKQVDIAAAMTNLTGAAQAAAVRSAERRHLARIWQAAASNGLSAAQQYAELHADPLPPENVVRTDGTAFNLLGWTYNITLAATFGGGDTISVLNADSGSVADFTENGTQTVELPYGAYTLSIPETSSGVTCTISVGTYSDGSGETP
jgi:hypothetical protein